MTKYLIKADCHNATRQRHKEAFTFTTLQKIVISSRPNTTKQLRKIKFCRIAEDTAIKSPFKT